MQKAIGAVVYHCSEANDPDARHIFVIKVPIFNDPQQARVVKKCLRGKTQNNNECLNGIVWKGCRKMFSLVERLQN